VPISHYGSARSRQEDLLRDWCRSTGHDGVIGRITNLYGPGQHLGKAQGLISQICKSYLLRQPVRLYVSLETTRDYLYVDDAGDMVRSLLEGPHSGSGGEAIVRILGSGAGVTLGGVLQVCERVLRRPLRIITVQSELTSLQSLDLRVRPRAPIRLAGGLTSLAVGVYRTFDDQLRQFQHGLLSSSPEQTVESDGRVGPRRVASALRV
jgi:UDP-glucose 4-epimerase